VGRLSIPKSQEQRAPFLRAQPRDETGQQDARLSQAAAAIEHQQRITAQSEAQLGNLRISPEEVGAGFFSKALQA
jgi:hypothetical protein